MSTQGAVTRSKTAKTHKAEEERALTATGTGGGAPVAAMSMEAAASRPRLTRSLSGTAKSTSREAARLRVEYEAEKEIASVKEQLIKKKLALDIAEIEDAEEEEWNEQEGGMERVTQWIETGGHEAVYPPAGEATCTYTYEQKFLERRAAACEADPPPPHPSNSKFVAASSDRRRDHATADEPSGAVGSSDIRQLASAIMAMSQQKYDLPEFDGNPVEWLSFKRAFEHSARHYSDYRNIVRLQKALSGGAKRAVDGLLRTGVNPTEVIEALDEEFGHPSLLLDNVLQKIRELPNVTEGSTQQLRSMTATVRNCVHILKSIRAEGYVNNPQIITQVLGKLTPIQRAQYGEFVMKMEKTRHFGEDLRISPNLNVVLEFLTHLCRAAAYYTPNFEPGTSSRRPIAHRVHVTDCDEITGVDDEEEKRNTVTCLLCDKSHVITECRVFVDKSNDDKWNFVKSNNLCFKCLKGKHSRYTCSAKRCGKCRAPHHQLLHFNNNDARSMGARPRPARPATERERAAPSSVDDPAAPTADSNGASAGSIPALAISSTQRDVQSESVTSVRHRGNEHSLLKILPVILTVNNVERACYCLLDDGATISLVDSSLVCNSSGTKMPLKIISASGHVCVDNDSRRVAAQITGPNGITHAINLRTMHNINLPSQTMSDDILQRYRHLRDLNCTAMSSAKPMLLIGQDNWELIVNQQIRQGKSGQPVASHTKLGWVVHGPVGKAVAECESVNFLSVTDELHDLVKQQFELESIGIIEKSRKNLSHERACDILAATSQKRVDGANVCWEVGLLWARDHIYLPNNYNYAFRRLRNVEKKMDGDPSFAAAYTKQIERLVNEKYAIILQEPVDTNPVWWLPHFAVVNVNKPGKVRLVWDCAAKSNNVCLNDVLLTGPDLLNSLLGVLLKFRLGPIAFTGDIVDCFMRIKIRKEDQGVQQFLWRGQDRTREPDTYVMDSMIFGAKSSPTTATYILRKNASEFIGSHPDAVEAINKKHYMDDYLDSTYSINAARELIQNVSMIHAAGGFEIRGWVTNSQTLRDELPAAVTGAVNLDKLPSSGERTLGMLWLPESDELAFDLSFKKIPTEIVEGRAIPTKREFLRIVMSVFDPLGLLCPFTIKAKFILQNIWKSGIGWDDQLVDNDAAEWRKWLTDIRQLSSLRVPRWYGLDLKEMELHVFGDASASGYAAVAYLVGRNSGGHPLVAMVGGKARVSPLRVISIPRMELQASVLACRLACTIQKEIGIDITRRVLWSDSKTVLKWIHSDPRDFQKFVSHRLAEIDNKSKVSEWRWVPTAENPADEATKAYWPTKFRLWFSGPSFLKLTPDKWPANEFEDHIAGNLERVEKINVVKKYEPIIDISRYSSWTRAVRVMSRVFAFVNLCRKKQSACLTGENVRDAEAFIIRQAQAEDFRYELDRIKTGGCVSEKSSIRDLDPFLFEGDDLMRVRGRLSDAPVLSFSEKHPIILSGRSHTARLIILDFHKRAHHANLETVLNSIREKFWITKLRRTVKAVVVSCQLCRIRRAMPIPPKMADLPPARLTNTRRAFVHCGIDYFGPMQVAIGRRREKRWGVIFTCLTTRAVSLDLAATLTADSAIMAIRRFVARRGAPSVMYSDRGTNFIKADKELRAALRAMNQDEVQDFVTAKGITWRFNSPASPHMGGCWERLIRTTKAALMVVLNERAPREEILSTVLAEVEMTLNSRPLTFVNNDPNEPIALTPNHLLLGTATGAPNLGSVNASDLNGRKAWRKAQAIADMFWRRWLKEYVPTLQRRQKWSAPTPPIKVGDVVLVHDDNVPRNVWPRGVISAVHPGRDGHVRIVTVKTSKGPLTRPVTKIIVLPTDSV